MLNNSSKKKIFPALTGYRAIAAWIIFIYHFFPFKNIHHNYPKWIADIIWEFHIGVDMFFVLSGFLIAYRYFGTSIDFKKYMTNRFARIYPMYFIITVLVFVVIYLKQGVWTDTNTLEAIFSFTMTKALFSDFFMSGISQGWTLTLEELFYLTAPLYFILIRKKTYWLCVLPIIIFLFGSVLTGLSLHFDYLGGFMRNNISVYIIEFFAGIALALFIKKKPVSVKMPIKITYIGLFFIGVYLCIMKYLYPIFELNSGLGRFISIGLLSFLGIAPLIWGLIFEDTWIQRMLSSKIMVLLGKSSYVFYLIHKGFVSIFIDEYVWSNKLFLFVALNVISILLFKYIEEPVNLYIKKVK
ncbi:acyltransferase family protein [Riemerella columbipharyngis]|uniref:Peptidoglycan/LPS O-acetylase OafA/YrhL, contains acyltransferase and SGNH-hydrolase domains n=1 Tax=Riemerella columbipharyngis TaxID=1071918 RepID=A0A1G7EBP5_9FLAO|nr:acyltransferase [Riemerella columbipharyngis]SDE61063.1 Peptidoglycan/LPS O-acetylase OafA/YrhL, contains acyltransferase and SGNH-hydrolase domains [Riemerella columbipharyngis]